MTTKPTGQISECVAREKTAKNGRRTCNASAMPAHAISRRRERRFLALVEAGATLAEAALAAQVSRQTVYRRARSDASFAHCLDLARAA
jgi:hypothetical protein